MTDITPAGSLWLAKIAGAVAGSAISLAFLFPHSRREAALRFLTGVTAGVVFGTTAGVAIADQLGIADVLSQFETVLMGSAVASVSIWWGMGVVLRLVDRRLPPANPPAPNKDDPDAAKEHAKGRKKGNA